MAIPLNNYTLGVAIQALASQNNIKVLFIDTGTSDEILELIAAPINSLAIGNVHGRSGFFHKKSTTYTTSNQDWWLDWFLLADEANIASVLTTLDTRFANFLWKEVPLNVYDADVTLDTLPKVVTKYTGKPVGYRLIAQTYKKDVILQIASINPVVFTELPAPIGTAIFVKEADLTNNTIPYKETIAFRANETKWSFVKSSLDLEAEMNTLVSAINTNITNIQNQLTVLGNNTEPKRQRFSIEKYRNNGDIPDNTTPVTYSLMAITFPNMDHNWSVQVNMSSIYTLLSESISGSIVSASDPNRPAILAQISEKSRTSSYSIEVNGTNITIAKNKMTESTAPVLYTPWGEGTGEPAYYNWYYPHIKEEIHCTISGSVLSVSVKLTIPTHVNGGYTINDVELSSYLAHGYVEVY